MRVIVPLKKTHNFGKSCGRRPQHCRSFTFSPPPLLVSRADTQRSAENAICACRDIAFNKLQSPHYNQVLVPCSPQQATNVANEAQTSPFFHVSLVVFRKVVNQQKACRHLVKQHYIMKVRYLGLPKVLPGRKVARVRSCRCRRHLACHRYPSTTVCIHRTNARAIHSVQSYSAEDLFRPLHHQQLLWVVRLVCDSDVDTSFNW